MRAWAAVGCTLSNPAEDLKYLFADMTTFREDLRNFETLPEGSTLYQQLQERVGGDLDPVYETLETPYTVYLVYQGEKLIGVVHGVNVRGKGGVIQVFLSTDPSSGEIRNFFFQRLESPVAKALKSKDFRDQFKGLTLADWYKHDYYRLSGQPSEQDHIVKIQKPTISADGDMDYEASMRGIRKNLILLDMFFYNHRFEPFYQRAKEALAKRAQGGTK
jgi:hypothetical protein